MVSVEDVDIRDGLAVSLYKQKQTFRLFYLGILSFILVISNIFNSAVSIRHFIIDFAVRL